MRIFWVPAFVVLANLAVPARAEPSPAPLAAVADTTDSAAVQEATAPGREAAVLPGQATSIPDAGLPRVALGLNAPWGWFNGSIGVSAYVGLGHHYAIRANVTRYRNAGPLAFPEDLPTYTGKILDVGVAWVWYPRQLWDGFMLEVGANRRGRDISVEDSDAELLVRTQSTAYAGRLMIGWSWLVTRHMFIAVAAGVSEGSEAGHETRTTMVCPVYAKSTTTAVDRLEVNAEAYLRFGVAFGH